MSEPQEERRDPQLEARRRAIDEIIEELEYQDKRWGQEHDKKHTPEEWCIILTVWMGKLANETPMFQGEAWHDKESLKKRFRQVGAIAAAALASLNAEPKSTGTA